ncbi:hypothetical protein KEM54_001991 [Ascosphaera aggregata]|nr:hypothetical protein KEM54_001991 [Ascosphaera aggregata]
MASKKGQRTVSVKGIFSHPRLQERSAERFTVATRSNNRVTKEKNARKKKKEEKEEKKEQSASISSTSRRRTQLKSRLKLQGRNESLSSSKYTTSTVQGRKELLKKFTGMRRYSPFPGLTMYCDMYAHYANATGLLPEICIAKGSRWLLDSLNTTREEIISSTTASLNETRTELESTLFQLVKDHNSKLAAYQANRQLLTAAAAAVTAAATTTTSSNTTDKKKVSSSYGGDYDDDDDNNNASNTVNIDYAGLTSFSKTYSKEKKALHKLWKDWSMIQRKMACLGVEVLSQGGSSVEEVVDAVDGAGTKKSYRKMVVGAFAACQERLLEQERCDGEQKRYLEEVKRICAESRAQAVELDKKTREEKRRQQQDVYQLAQKMLLSL